MFHYNLKTSFTLLTNISLSSMVTALVEVNPTLGDEIDTRNQISVLVAFQCDDMPLCPSSSRQEDVVELCKKIGKEHPEDVLKLSVTKLVPGFKCECHIMATMCHLNVATILWGKLIILHSLPSKHRQVKEYITVGVVSHLVPRHVTRVGQLVIGLSPMWPAQRKDYTGAPGSTSQTEEIKEV